MSGVRDLVDVYRLLAARCDYPLHLGLTEAGMGDKGIIASTAGLAILLNEGIGDTIRVSLTPEPGAPREREVEVAQQVLQSMGLRSFLPQVSACPGCGRTTSTFFQEMAQQIQGYLKDRMPEWKETHPGAEELRVAVMGCVVNGPGESKHADIGISLPGTFEEPVAPVFIDGKLDRTLRGDGLVAEFIDILEDYVAQRYPSTGTRRTGCPSAGGACRPSEGPAIAAHHAAAPGPGRHPRHRLSDATSATSAPTHPPPAPVKVVDPRQGSRGAEGCARPGRAAPHQSHRDEPKWRRGRIHPGGRHAGQRDGRSCLVPAGERTALVRCHRRRRCRLRPALQGEVDEVTREAAPGREWAVRRHAQGQAEIRGPVEDG